MWSDLIKGNWWLWDWYDSQGSGGLVDCDGLVFYKDNFCNDWF